MSPRDAGNNIPDFYFREGKQKGNIILQVLKKWEPEANSFTFSKKKGIPQWNVPQILTALHKEYMTRMSEYQRENLSFSTQTDGSNQP